MACEVIVVQKSPFTEKLGFCRKMAKIWHKVQENGSKKIRLAKLVAKEKKNLAQTLRSFSYLQAMRTCIKAWMSSKFGQIRPLVSMATDSVII